VVVLLIAPMIRSSTLHAPFGYQGYKWFDNTFSQVLGTQQTISFSPSRVPGNHLRCRSDPL
jgi:hypothetical protein